LRAWGDLASQGKKLRIDISFIYKEHGQPITRRTRPSAGRGASAAQLAERDTLLDEQEALGRPCACQDVYRLMQCDGHLCHLGPYCWRNEDGRKQYKLDTKIGTKLVKYAEEGYPLRTHDDVHSVQPGFLSRVLGTSLCANIVSVTAPKSRTRTGKLGSGRSAISC
jgi:hypothetical protein